MKILSQLLIITLSLFSCTNQPVPKLQLTHTLHFNELAQAWDEAIPLGNGKVGALVWQKHGKLRFSLDRADLWDLRPMANIHFDKLNFKDVYQYWKNDEYNIVQKAYDDPYGQLAAPSKIPAGALEFDISALGKINSVVLDLQTAVCTVEWENGAKLTTFVDTNKAAGWYRFENIDKPVPIELIAPAYNLDNGKTDSIQSLTDLAKLGYPKGDIVKHKNALTYNQKCWGDFSYQINTQWKNTDKEMSGCWSVSSTNTKQKETPFAVNIVDNEMKTGFENTLKTHLDWWSAYWKRSSIEIPDSLIEQQYYLEMYKFGAAARADAPPISLQSVWTADNGNLPPWKGDFHHDLNTQLSYWPSYTGNHLDLEQGYINWLWKNRPTFKRYTKEYFETDGMNVPGVTTLDGEPMGGWIQYAMGQTVAAWLGEHFYLHWKYTMDKDFLKNRAYPWLKDVAVFLDEISIKNDKGKRKLRISSSPEIYGNARKAWFDKTTNFDLALIRFTYAKAAEMATELGLNDEAEKWKKILSEWPDYAIDPQTGFMFAPGSPYNQSHRHFSHLLAFHPLGLVDFSNGEKDKTIILNSIKNLDKYGSDWWTGYSFSWEGNLYARAFDGENAARVLRKFANCFCLKNSFHINSNQCKTKNSYRPFTLEGNFAFAAAVQEMLLQSHTGVVKIFPAIPKKWNNAKFTGLRAQGAFVVSAQKENGAITKVTVLSEKGGKFIIENPFNGKFKANKKYKMEGKNIIVDMKAGETLKLITI